MSPMSPTSPQGVTRENREKRALLLMRHQPPGSPTSEVKLRKKKKTIAIVEQQPKARLGLGRTMVGPVSADGVSTPPVTKEPGAGVLECTLQEVEVEDLDQMAPSLECKPMAVVIQHNEDSHNAVEPLQSLSAADGLGAPADPFRSRSNSIMDQASTPKEADNAPLIGLDAAEGQEPVSTATPHVLGGARLAVALHKSVAQWKSKIKKADGWSKMSLPQPDSTVPANVTQKTYPMEPLPKPVSCLLRMGLTYETLPLDGVKLYAPILPLPLCTPQGAPFVWAAQ